MIELKAYRKNRKGFTLIELIVVIVIIAILIAALTPAILGVIDRANRSADEAEARSLWTAALAAADFKTGTKPTAQEITDMMTGGNGQVTVNLYFQGAAVVAVELLEGRLAAGKYTTTPFVLGDKADADTTGGGPFKYKFGGSAWIT
ncbi:MAG: prepilin-type N-terminal cleavage/methylation domain-containing protein [Oscillospiraceae bacterium]|nr:prepilin-type N-terminal cleavage/methylation domain-containing protein [Oscillospiraceae bacterium]